MYFFKIFLIFALGAWFFIGETEARRWPEERFDSKVYEEQFDNPKFDSKVYKEQFDNPKFDSKVNEEQFDNPKFDSKVYEEQFDNPKFDSKVYEEPFDNPNNQARQLIKYVQDCESETETSSVNVTTLVKQIFSDRKFCPKTITQYFCKTAQRSKNGSICETFVRRREFSMLDNKNEHDVFVHGEVKVGCFTHKIKYG